MTTYTRTTRDYTLQFTDRLVCRQSIPVSTSRFLATDFNTGTITVSLNYTLQISHIRCLHRRTVATNTFLHSLPSSQPPVQNRTDNCMSRPNCLQNNSSARTAQKTATPLYCCRGVFSGPLHRNGLGADHIENAILLLRACMLRTLPSNISVPRNMKTYTQYFSCLIFLQY
jgi:hypothetical protein